ncbi:hypothetical protein KI387_002932, partial [Taxus chinensis]
FKSRRVSIPLHQVFFRTLVKRESLDFYKYCSLPKSLKYYSDGVESESEEEYSSDESDSQESDLEEDKY